MAESRDRNSSSARHEQPRLGKLGNGSSGDDNSSGELRLSTNAGGEQSEWETKRGAMALVRSRERKEDEKHYAEFGEE